MPRPFTYPLYAVGLDLLQSISNKRLFTFNEEYDSDTVGATATIDWNNGQKQKVTLTEACTLTFEDPPGPGNFILKVVPAGYGITWPDTVKWPAGTPPTLSSATDIVAFYYDGDNYYGVASLNFS